MAFGIPDSQKKIGQIDELDYAVWSLKRTLKDKFESWLYKDGEKPGDGAMSGVSIKFSHNWNGKLRCDYFTTIRRWTPEKEAYYRSCVGKPIEVNLKGVRQNFSELRSVVVMKYSEISFLIKILDTGSERPDEIFKQFNIAGEDAVLLLLLKRAIK